MAGMDGLNPQLAAALQGLIAASNGKVRLVSGYRSVERQSQLWAGAIKKYGKQGARKWVAPPGKSNHNHGLAVDLGGDLELAARLAPQFGLYRPMSWEPWHFELADAEDTGEGRTEPPDGHQEEPTNYIEILKSMLGMDEHQDVDPMFAGIKDPSMQVGMQQMGSRATGGQIETLVEAAREAGFTGEKLVLAVAVGLAEGSNTGARNVNNDRHRSVDRGWWQWNDYWHPEVSDEEADDPFTSARHVFRVTHGGEDWRQWTTYKTGAYAKHLQEARMAVAA